MTTTINDLYLDLRRRFREAEVSQAELEARELTAFAAGVDKRQTANWGYLYLADGTAKKAEELADRRLAGEPLAYLLGEWDFYGLTFKVTPSVLIPRSDTERLCELAVARAKEIVNPRVLDLCCGTGCIGIALLKEVVDARVVSVDLSEDALGITKENARTHAVASRHIAVRGDALQEPDERLGRFHVLVCNPPYVTAQEMKMLDRSVREYEPVLALFGGEDGLDFYRSVTEKWRDAVFPGGTIFFECGDRQYPQVAGILEENGWRDVKINEDLSGVLRIVSATLPQSAE